MGNMLSASRAPNAHGENEEEHRHTKRVVNFCPSLLEQQQLRGFRLAAGFPRSVQRQQRLAEKTPSLMDSHYIQLISLLNVKQLRSEKPFGLVAKDVATLTR